MSTPSDPVPPAGFEDSLLALQEIVADLESGSITLDESLLRFEAGVGLLRQCYQFLERAEQRIEQLVNLDSQGNCTLAPFDATATVDKQTRPTAKASAKKSTRNKEPGSAPPVPEPIDEDSESEGKLLF